MTYENNTKYFRTKDTKVVRKSRAGVNYIKYKPTKVQVSESEFYNKEAKKKFYLENAI